MSLQQDHDVQVQPVDNTHFTQRPGFSSLYSDHCGSGYSTDAALWNPINEEHRSYWIRNGPASCQNKECDFSSTLRMYGNGTGDKLQKRFLSDTCFRRELRNGETVCREWLLYGLSDNLQHVSNARKTAVINNELRRLQVDIIALQETRLAESSIIRERDYSFF
jgi:hypothetical protein